MKIMDKLRNMDLTAKSSIKNFLIRPLGMILAAVYTPLLLDYLGTEANGVWASILSVITWVNYCDLGIGNGLRNLLIRELTRKEYEKAQRSVSTAYVVLTCIAVVILGVLLVFAFALDWNGLFQTELRVRPMVLITFVFIALNFVLALSNSILYALQLSERVSVRSCLVQVMNIIGLLLLRAAGTADSLTAMAILFGSTTSVVYIWNSVHIVKNRKYLAPKISLFDKSKIGEICNFGLQFFVIQLTAVLILSSHNMIVSYLFGAAAVTPMHTVSTVYAAGYSFMAALVVPFWSRTTQALENGEFAWIRNSIKRVRQISYVFILGFIAVALVYEDIACVWLGKALDYPPGVIGATCLFYIMEVVNLIYVQFYYGMGQIKPYMYLTVVQAVAIVPLSWLLSKPLGLGVAGVKLAAAAMLAISGVIVPYLTYRRLNYCEAQWKEKESAHGSDLLADNTTE